MTAHEGLPRGMNKPVERLAWLGVPAVEIAFKLGISRFRVHKHIQRQRELGKEFPKPAPRKGYSTSVQLNVDQRFILQQYANARNTTWKKLIKQLVSIMIEDELIDSILDDGVKVTPQKPQ